MIRIIADTTCGIPVQQLIEKGIHVIPQIITFSGSSYRDDYEIDTETFLIKLRESKQLPGTAAPPPALYLPVFKEILEAGDTILVITPSQKVSGTYRSAILAAEEFNTDRIHVIDSKTVAGGLGSLVLQAKQWADTGMDIVPLQEKLVEMATREKVFFVVDTLEYLYKGGRIGGASRLIGSVLQIKPILTVNDGQVETFDKVRTSKQAIANIIDMDVKVCSDNPDPWLTVSHCGAEETARFIVDSLKAKLNLQEIPIYVIPPAIVVHAGPGVVTTSCFSSPNHHLL